MKDVVDKKIATRIRNLLAKSRGTDSEAEAAMFAQRAAEMLQEHNLKEADLGGDDAVEPMIQRTVHSVDWNPWRMDIIQDLAELYFSRIFLTREIHQGKLRRAVVLVGRPHNLDVVESMQDYLVKTTLRLAKEYSRDRKQILHFEKGCGTRLAQRIREMAAASRAPVKPAAHLAAPTGTTLPALYKTELELADSIITGICGGSTARASGHRGSSSATRAGRSAADTVNLGTQIGKGKVGHLLGHG